MSVVTEKVTRAHFDTVMKAAAARRGKKAK
jgi:hypothetical protein